VHLFDDMDEAVIEHDGNIICWANPAAVKLFRYPSAEIMACLSILELVDDISVPLAIRRAEKLRHQPAQVLPDAQYIFRRADKTRFVGQAHTRNFFWAESKCRDGRIIPLWSRVLYIHEVA
jgi:PAS domain-containing protein